MGGKLKQKLLRLNVNFHVLKVAIFRGKKPKFSNFSMFCEVIGNLKKAIAKKKKIDQTSLKAFLIRDLYLRYLCLSIRMNKTAE